MAAQLYKVQGAVAAIQVDRVQAGYTPNYPVTSSPTDVEKDGIIEKEDARMRQCFDQTKYAELGISDHYANISVLIVHWARELDRELNCWEEVEQLDKLFRNEFGFNSEVVTLDSSSRRPQLQLDKALMDFVHDHDGPPRENLLIVYYTGHGYTDLAKPGQLFIAGTANGNSTAESQPYRPHASWTDAVRTLDNAEADTLLILDCCSASNFMKGTAEHPRSYEVMAATGRDMPTASGSESYTIALIKSLRTLLAEQQPFTTYDLNQRIIRERDWNTSSQLYSKHPSVRTRHICLAPPAKRNASQVCSPTRRAGYLDLRIAFENDSTLSLEQVKQLCSELCKLPKSTGVRICDLEWHGFRPYKNSPQFKKLVRMIRTRFLFRKAMLLYKTKTRKRKVNEELLANGTGTKRRRTASAAPPPPVDTTMKGLEAQPPLTPSASSRGATPTS